MSSQYWYSCLSKWISSVTSFLFVGVGFSKILHPLTPILILIYFGYCIILFRITTTMNCNILNQSFSYPIFQKYYNFVISKKNPLFPQYCDMIDVYMFCNPSMLGGPFFIWCLVFQDYRSIVHNTETIAQIVFKGEAKNVLPLKLSKYSFLIRFHNNSLWWKCKRGKSESSLAIPIPYFFYYNTVPILKTPTF